MRVLMLSWEYPPHVVGGLGRHVHALATALAAAGNAVTVVTRHAGDPAHAPYDEVREGVRVRRVPADPPLVPPDDLLASTLALGHGLARTALAVAAEGPFDVVHAHDWLVTHAAKAVKDALDLPLVGTVHATEAGRHQGWLPGPMNRAIHTTEWWLTYEARRIVTCSSHMRREVTRLFDLPPDKVDVIPNGIDLARWTPTPAGVAAARAAYADPAGGPLVLYSGRLVFEKGVHDVLRALPRLRRRHPGLRLVVAGAGPQERELRALARALRLGRAVRFAGFLAEPELARLAAAADVAVVPSLYEPFGLVALEAAAAGTPLAVADTGGLREFVEPGVTGLRFPAGDVPALARAVDALLRDEVLARRLARSARRRLARDHTWAAVAARTVTTYERAVREERALRAGLAARAELPVRLVVRDGNLLAGEGDG